MSDPVAQDRGNLFEINDEPAMSPLARTLTIGAITVALGVMLGLGGCATSSSQDSPTSLAQTQYNQSRTPGEYNDSELVSAVSNHLGVTSESAASTIENLFKKQGRPVGYITGEEGGGAFIGGARWGKGTHWMKDGRSMKDDWQGPTVGADWGAEASKVFTLVYGLDNPELLFRRFPGAEGTATLVAGMAINYQRTDGITLAPVRTNIGARIGVNVGYTRYTKKRKIIPL